MLATAVLWSVVALAAMTAWTDWRRREIPHWTTAGLLAVWAVAAAWVRPALGGPVVAGLVCGSVGLALGVALYAFGWLGGGDGKLLAVLALWLGPYDVGFALLAAAALLFLLLIVARTGRGAMRCRGIPVACALAPPAVALLAARAMAFDA